VAAEAARLALSEAERAQQAATEAHNRAQQEVRRAQEVQQEVERRRERAERELAQSNALAERLVSRLAELEQRTQQLAAQAEALHARAGEADSDITDAREALSVAERDQEQAREARATWQVAQAQAQARLSVAIDREKRLAEEDSTAAARLESLARELSTLSEADQDLLTQLEGWRTELETERKNLADADARLAEAERAVSAATAQSDACESVLDEARRRAGALGEQLHGAQLRHTELSGRRETIRQRLETEWRRSLDDLLTGFEELDLETDALREEAKTLREALDDLGPVNPLAIEEHEEEQRRLEFLTSQRNDLVAAKQSLHQAIREIDSTARELFLATFAQVRENFRQIFLRMFGGGECDLRLENPDAPLDDQNIGRFVKMLNDFKGRTQFIVITHNPRTTSEAADAVYGVTMQEPGVSSIVSVRLRNGPSVDESPANTPVVDELSPDRAELDALDGEEPSEPSEDGAEPEPSPA
jgi:chromosome segregation protein